MREKSIRKQISTLASLLFLAGQVTFLTAWTGLGCTVTPVAASLEQEEEPPPPAARQNPILRAFFREQYLGLRGGDYDINEAFMEKYVDREIDLFLAGIDQRLCELDSRLDEAEAELEKLRKAPDSAGKTEGKRRWAKALRGVEGCAGRLRGRLAIVFSQLDGKEKLPIDIGRLEDDDESTKAMAFLKAQVTKAEQGIRDYLFRSTNIVPYQELKGENMIIRLYWAEEAADRMESQLRR